MSVDLSKFAPAAKVRIVFDGVLSHSGGVEIAGFYLPASVVQKAVSIDAAPEPEYAVGTVVRDADGDVLVRMGQFDDGGTVWVLTKDGSRWRDYMVEVVEVLFNPDDADDAKLRLS